jgi:hypothetical protein
MKNIRTSHYLSGFNENNEEIVDWWKDCLMKHKFCVKSFCFGKSYGVLNKYGLSYIYIPTGFYLPMRRQILSADRCKKIK